MLKDVWKIFAFTEFHKLEAGFTYISSLIRLMIITISLPILLYGLSKVKVIPSEESLMIHQLYFLLQNELYMATHIAHDGKRIYYQLESGEIASIERYQSLLRRRVEGRGHEIYARNIQAVKIESVPYGINMTIETTKGGVYERTLVTRKQ